MARREDIMGNSMNQNKFQRKLKLSRPIVGKGSLELKEIGTHKQGILKYLYTQSRYKYTMEKKEAYASQKIINTKLQKKY